MIPKAELHCHIEGAAEPALVRRLAKRNGVTLPAELFNAAGDFAWTDFSSFLAAYDLASSCLRTAADYRDLIFDYLAACAAEGALYVEVFSSPDHAAAVGLSYAAQNAGLAAGIEAAERQFGIKGRVIVTCVRHLGPERAVAVARAMVAEPNPYVVGFGMGGDERKYDARDFLPAFRIAADAGYACTAHAGEVMGPDSVRAVLTALPVSRIGHGVRAAEDPRLVAEIARRGLVLEVCPGSNLALGVYPDAAAHPLQSLLRAGCKVTLNSDDPPFFRTSIGREYAFARDRLGLDAGDLMAITRNAVDAAFADPATKAALRRRLDDLSLQPATEGVTP